MNTRFLEALVWVARLGSFRAAADRLHLTQAAISSRIASLEDGFGKRLFDRDMREVRLTSAGRLLLGHAERMLAQERQMHSELQASAVISGVVRIGVVETIVHTWLVDLLGALQEACPTVEIELTAEPTQRLHDQLRRGQLDVTLQSDPVIGENIYNRGIGNMPLVWIGPPDADVSAARSVAHLVEMPLITMTRGSQPHLALLEACRRAGVHHRTLHCVGSIAAIVRLVRAGLGVALMPRAPVRTELENALLRMIPCSDPLCPLPLVVSHAADPTSDVGRIVSDMAAREARRYAERHGPDIATPAPD